MHWKRESIVPLSFLFSRRALPRLHIHMKVQAFEHLLYVLDILFCVGERDGRV